MSNCNSTDLLGSFLPAFRSLVGAPDSWVPDPFDLSQHEYAIVGVADLFGIRPVEVFTVLFEYSLEQSSLSGTELAECYASILSVVRGARHA